MLEERVAAVLRGRPERAPPPRVYAQTSYLRVPSFG